MTTTPEEATRNDSYECLCPTCTISRAQKVIDAAMESWAERENDCNMNYAHLLDEVQQFLVRPWWRRRLRSLRRAVDVVAPGSLDRAVERREDEK